MATTPAPSFSIPSYNVEAFVTVSLDYTNCLTSNNLMGYVDGTVTCPQKPSTTSTTAATNPSSTSFTTALAEWNKSQEANQARGKGRAHGGPRTFLSRPDGWMNPRNG